MKVAEVRVRILTRRAQTRARAEALPGGARLPPALDPRPSRYEATYSSFQGSAQVRYHRTVHREPEDSAHEVDPTRVQRMAQAHSFLKDRPPGIPSRQQLTAPEGSQQLRTPRLLREEASPSSNAGAAKQLRCLIGHINLTSHRRCQINHGQVMLVYLRTTRLRIPIPCELSTQPPEHPRFPGVALDPPALLPSTSHSPSERHGGQ